MILKSLYFYESQIKFLEKLEGNFSEHVRKAVERYIYELRGNKTSASESKRVGDKNDG